MSNVKEVITHLRTLASDPENGGYIVQDNTCFQGIVRFLDNADHEVVSIALEALKFLSLNPDNREQMAKTPTLATALKRLMMDFTVPHSCKQLAGNVYASLQRYFDQMTNGVINSSNNNPNSSGCNRNVSAKTESVFSSTNSAPLKEHCTNESLSGNVGCKGTGGVFGAGTGSGLSVFSDKGNVQLTSARTHTLQVRSLMDPNVRTMLEAKLLSTAGVISFLMDPGQCLVTIRATRSAGDLSAVLGSIHLHAVVISEGESSTKENVTEKGPEYLPETTKPPVTGSGSWFSSIVSWGTSTVDERQANQKLQEQKKRQKSTHFMSRLYAVGESLWQ